MSHPPSDAAPPPLRLPDRPSSIEAERSQALYYGQHASVLRKYTRCLVEDPELAEDIVRATLSQGWQDAGLLDDSESSARAWLFTTALHRVIDEQRRIGYDRELGINSASRAATPEQAEDTVHLQPVADALATLSREHRDVIVLGYYRGQSTRQIAAALHVPDAIVKSRMHHGMRALWAALHEPAATT